MHPPTGQLALWLEIRRGLQIVLKAIDVYVAEIKPPH